MFEYNKIKRLDILLNIKKNGKKNLKPFIKEFVFMFFCFCVSIFIFSTTSGVLMWASLSSSVFLLWSAISLNLSKCKISNLDEFLFERFFPFMASFLIGFVVLMFSHAISDLTIKEVENLLTSFLSSYVPILSCFSYLVSSYILFKKLHIEYLKHKLSDQKHIEMNRIINEIKELDKISHFEYIESISQENNFHYVESEISKFKKEFLKRMGFGSYSAYILFREEEKSELNITNSIPRSIGIENT